MRVCVCNNKATTSHYTYSVRKYVHIFSLLNTPNFDRSSGPTEGGENEFEAFVVRACSITDSIKHCRSKDDDDDNDAQSVTRKGIP